MLTGKQRSYLKGIANTLKPILQIGKDGISDGFIAQLEETIAVREMVKISILESCDIPAKEAARILTERTGSEFVQAIGRKLVLYRLATEPENQKIEIPGMPKRKVIKAPVVEVAPEPVRPAKPKVTVPVSGKAKAAPAKTKPNSAKKAREVAKERSKKAKTGPGARGSKPGASRAGGPKKTGSGAKRPAKRG